MEKGKIIGIVTVVAVVVVAASITGFIVLTADPCAEQETVLTITGNGVNEDTELSLCHLQLDKHSHVTNKEYDWRNKAATEGTDQYTGIVLWSLLSGLINGDAANLQATIEASDGYSQDLPLSDIQTEGENIILAYGGTDFDPESDGTLKLVVDLSYFGEDGVNTHYWIRDVVEIVITAI